MNFQYYETLSDKSKKYLSYLVEHIEPKFTVDELPIFFDDMNKKPLKQNESKKLRDLQGFLNIGDDYETTADISKLSIDQLKMLYQIFISREFNNKLAVKWRVYQYFKYVRGILIESMLVNRTNSSDISIDFIIETTEGKIILILCFDVLGVNIYNKVIENIRNFIDIQKIIPHRIILATNKIYRNISIENPVKFNGTEILPEFWVEWIETNKPFEGEDLLIVNNTELKVAGFNFSSTDDLLDFVFENSDGGQVSIFRQRDFFSASSDTDIPEIYLIWKGIMLREGNL
ncbi:MAG: hypothetical protein EU539_03730 [Promethearchaeota archaeon]|nr:MAG: hypothetical protein EU539_03730 [Candidatus Lokiarchaeota archaeon]